MGAYSVYRFHKLKKLRRASVKFDKPKNKDRPITQKGVVKNGKK